MTERRRWGRVAPVAAVLIVGVLAGCVRIPLDGDVSTVAIADIEGGDQLIVVPEGPVDGASPREILRGFVLAGRGPQNGYEVATEFLTDAFATEWWPSGGVIVTSSTFAPAEVAEDRLTLTVEASATLDSRGRYLAGEPTSHELDFEFELEEGQWRISAAPDGTVLSPASFDAIFSETSLYFWSPDFRYLVPEQRWFLDTRTVANRVVDELLAADSAYVGTGVLVTAFPEGTERPESVDLVDGRASVTLSSEVLAASRQTQSRMLAQLDWSLASLGDVDSATIVAGGFPVGIESLDTIDRLQVGAAPIVMIDGTLGTLGTLAGESVVPLDAFGTALAGVEFDAFTLGRSGMDAAVLVGGVAGYATATGVETRDDRPGLAAPSLDPWGWLWSVPVDSPSGLMAFASGADARTLALDQSGTITALRVSRDGTRLLAAVDGSGGTRVMVAGIARTADLTPTALVDPVVIASGVRLLDAAWVSGTEIALLSASGAVNLVELGGQTVSLGAVSGAAHLAGGNAVEGLRVLDEAGQLWRHGGDVGWLEAADGISLLGVQQ